MPKKKPIRKDGSKPKRKPASMLKKRTAAVAGLTAVVASDGERMQVLGDSTDRNVVPVPTDTLLAELEQEGLNLRQALFVSHFLTCYSITEAYRRAGYECTGDTQYAAASQVYGSIRVKAAIEKRLNTVFDSLDVSRDRIILELANVAFSNLADTEDEDGVPIPLRKLPRKTSSTIKEVNTTVKYTKSGEKYVFYTYKQHDKLRAMELLGKILGIVENKLNVDVQGKVLHGHVQANPFAGADMEAIHKAKAALAELRKSAAENAIVEGKKA